MCFIIPFMIVGCSTISSVSPEDSQKSLDELHLYMLDNGMEVK